MRKRTLIWCVAALGLSIWARPAIASDRAPTPDVIHQIEAAAARGTLDFESALLYKVRAISNPAALPEPYRAQATATPIRCGTPVVAEAYSSLNRLSVSAQNEITSSFSRRPTDSTYVSPGGYFVLHYDLDSVNAVPSADDDSSGFPDFIERLALYLDSAWNVEVETLGWRRPPSDGTAGGDSLYDVYPTSIGFTYGVTVQDSPGPEEWNDYSSYILLNKSFLGFPPNDDPEGDQIGSMKVTCAHEFNHACQFATSPLHTLVADSWWQEISATWMEDIVYDMVNDNYNYLEDYFVDPTISLFDGGLRKYGAFGFAKVMEEAYDTAVVRDAWELMRWLQAKQAIDSAMSFYGSGLSGLFARFADWNYFTNSRDDGLHFSEGAEYPLMPIYATHLLYPILNRPGPDLQTMASSYIHFEPDPSGRDMVEFTFNGANGIDWAPTLIQFDSSGSRQTFEFDLDPVTSDGKLYLSSFDDMARAVLIGNNVHWSGGADHYTYSVRFLTRADCDDDADADIFDMLYLIESIFSGGPLPVPVWQMGDLNCSGGLDILDVSISIDYILKDGAAPCAPFE
ncbi:MAG: hypothetical protein GF341_04295 [candidate division Zixibacteria bacterium]|nr:hypothetical protein [candidate division Zixibacteria bacterium]